MKRSTINGMIILCTLIFILTIVPSAFALGELCCSGAGSFEQNQACADTGYPSCSSGSCDDGNADGIGACRIYNGIGGYCDGGSYRCSSGSCISNVCQLSTPSCTGAETPGSVSCNQAPTYPNTPKVLTTGNCDGYTACQYWCGSNGYYYNGACVARKTLGASCSSNNECASNDCHGGFCQQAVGIGGLCANLQTYCSSGFCKVENGQYFGICTSSDKSLGASCTDSRECASGDCHDGFCQSGVGLGSLCANLQIYCTTGYCKVESGQYFGFCSLPTSYSCQGPFPPAGTYAACPGADTGLSANQGSYLLNPWQSCSGAKCEYFCTGGTSACAGTCVTPKPDNAFCTNGCECAGGQCAGGYCSTPVTLVSCDSPSPSGAGVNLIMSQRSINASGAWSYIDPAFVGPVGYCTWTCANGYERSGNSCVLKTTQPACTASDCGSWGACTNGFEFCTSLRVGSNCTGTPVRTCGGGPVCNPYSDAQFCATYGKNCGIFSGTDNCANFRSVNCSSATGVACNSPNTCT
ncbi:MAG TPA: hypothetical protein VK158_05260, partial [Acidobacteriota bacterium]|nr:hypothetical protein [Acidobacteriota bacterium]